MKDLTETDNWHIKTCDFCNEIASYDAKTTLGPWANMCKHHYKQLGIGLGLGKGQKLLNKGSKA